jgi:hypothetical protein
LELRHTERSTNAAGHIVVTIQPFAQEMNDLTNRMWLDLATVFNPAQLAAAKTQHFERFFPHTGRRPVIVEIWQDAETGQFHYIEKEPAGRNDGVAERLPPRYHGFFFRDNQNTNNGPK